MLVATLLPLVVGALLGFLLLFAMGANDVANALGTAVGSGALTLNGTRRDAHNRDGSAIYIDGRRGSGPCVARFIRRTLPLLAVAGVFEFAGAVLAGSHVTRGVGERLVSFGAARDSATASLGVLASSLLLVALGTACALPLSASHAVSAALVAIGAWRARVGGQAAAADVVVLHWTTIAWTALAWVLSPLVGGALGYLAYALATSRMVLAPMPAAEVAAMPVDAARDAGRDDDDAHADRDDDAMAEAVALRPAGMAALAGLVAGTLALFLLAAGPQAMRAMFGGSVAAPVAAVLSVAALAALVFWIMREQACSVAPLSTAADAIELDMLREDGRRVPSRQDPGQRSYGHAGGFRALMIVTACAIAFAHGGNDVANGTAPFLMLYRSHASSPQPSPPPSPPPSSTTAAIDGHALYAILAVGGVAIVLGLCLFGHAVIETVGRRIAKLDYCTGFAAQYAAAAAVLAASCVGLPVSTTQVVVSAVAGAAAAQGGVASTSASTLRRIVCAWLATIPAAAVAGILFSALFSAWYNR